MIFIVHPNVPEEETSAVADKVTSIINQNKGEVVALKKWGKKRFSYNIKKCTKGYYFLLHFLATPALLAELERILRYDEKILRYQTVKAGKEEIEALRESRDQDQGGEEHSPPLGEEASTEA
jgi:small subunit ribosomal protein S6